MVFTALLSVSDKRGLVPLAEALHHRFGYQLLSSGGTARCFKTPACDEVADHTGAPEILGGRVKTLHPRIHGGILARRGDAAHEADLVAQNIDPIDVVVVNLYPFRETVADPAVSWDKAIENIDIGGPTMVAQRPRTTSMRRCSPTRISTTGSWQRSRRLAVFSMLRSAGNWRLRHCAQQRPTTRPSPAGCRPDQN